LDSHLDIDVDRVTKQDSNNPIFYVQYAHARINQLLEKNKNDVTYDKSLELLISPIEKELKNLIVNYKYLIKQISTNYEIH
jgi:arginyl-tRNA synthetase